MQQNGCVRCACTPRLMKFLLCMTIMRPFLLLDPVYVWVGFFSHLLLQPPATHDRAGVWYVILFSTCVYAYVPAA